MKTNIVPIIGISLLAAGIFPAAQAQAKKPAPPKKAATAGNASATAKPADGKKPIVLGTKQLAGDFGQFGQTYTIGKQVPINITLNRAEYTTARFSVDENSFIPAADQKLLVLHYTIHNPNPSEQAFQWDSLKFTAVDKKDVNHEYIQAVTREGTTEKVDVSLKPAQKLDVQAAILVPTEGVVPKLIIQREEGAPVIRYDLRGKVKPLTETIADPADPSGATALKVAPAQMGAYYPYGAFDIKVDSVSYTSAPTGDGDNSAAPEDGKRYTVIAFTLRNATTAEQRYYWANFAPEVIDADGEKLEYNQTLLKASRNEAAEGVLKPGEEARMRLFYVLPENVGAKTLTLAETMGNDLSHGYRFDLSSAPK